VLPVPFVLGGGFIPLAAGRGFVDLHLSFRVSFGWPHVHGDGDSWFYDMLPGRWGYDLAGGP
jgi:hypothetical protein